jgi:hypothetical protein
MDLSGSKDHHPLSSVSSSDTINDSCLIHSVFYLLMKIAGI